jgi:hypothetical protein
MVKNIWRSQAGEIAAVKWSWNSRIRNKGFHVKKQIQEEKPW